MSLRRWNSVMEPVEPRSLGTPTMESSNLRKLSALTRSSPNVAKPLRAVREVDDTGDSESSDSSDCGLSLAPTTNKTRQKKFLRHFQRNEQVLEYYSCAFVAEILLQGYLYITKNYIGFYSNVFGRVTKILIPIRSIEKITKNNTALIFPNAIRVYTKAEKYSFASFISRDAACQILDQVMSASKCKLEKRKSNQQLRFNPAESQDNEADTLHDNALEEEEDVHVDVITLGDIASVTTSAAAVDSVRPPPTPSRRLIYLLFILVIILSGSAINLYIRIDRLMQDDVDHLEAVTLKDGFPAMASQNSNYDLTTEEMFRRVSKNIERIQQITAALEELNSHYSLDLQT